MVTKTLNAGAGAAFSIDLTDDDGGCGRIEIFSRIDCWVLPTTNKDLAEPAGTPAPGAGLKTDYIHLTAGERLGLDLNQGVLSPAPPANRPIRRIVGWAIGAGEVIVTGN